MNESMILEYTYTMTVKHGAWMDRMDICQVLYAVFCSKLSKNCDTDEMIPRLIFSITLLYNFIMHPSYSTPHTLTLNKHF